MAQCPKSGKSDRIALAFASICRMPAFHNFFVFHSFLFQISVNINKPWSCGFLMAGPAITKAVLCTATQRYYRANNTPDRSATHPNFSLWMKNGELANSTISSAVGLEDGGRVPNQFPLCIQACADLCSNFTPIRANLLRKIELICKLFKTAELLKNGIKRRI